MRYEEWVEINKLVLWCRWGWWNRRTGHMLGTCSDGPVQSHPRLRGTNDNYGAIMLLVTMYLAQQAKKAPAAPPLSSSSHGRCSQNRTSPSRHVIVIPAP